MMTDMEKVVVEIEDALSGNLAKAGRVYNLSLVGLKDKALTDALALLKEQEAVEPIIMDHIVFGTSRKCSKCNQYLFPAGRYCPHCGRSVKWND